MSSESQQQFYEEVAAIWNDRAWQPIETAPKMKTILLFVVTDQAEDGTVRNWKMATGIYHDGWTPCDEQRGYSPWCWEGDHIPPWGHLPTHWMPLPSAPVL